MTADVPRGQRFSHVYVARGEPTQDSPRMRRRIASLIGAESERWRSTIETAAMSKRHGTRSKKLGNAVPKRGDPDAVYCDCEPDHCHRPSRPNSRTGFCDHLMMLRERDGEHISKTRYRRDQRTSWHPGDPNT